MKKVIFALIGIVIALNANAQSTPVNTNPPVDNKINRDGVNPSLNDNTDQKGFNSNPDPVPDINSTDRNGNKSRQDINNTNSPAPDINNRNGNGPHRDIIDKNRGNANPPIYNTNQDGKDYKTDQNPNRSDNSLNHQAIDKSHPDGVMMQNGKMILVRDGKMTRMEKDMTTNGVKIMSDGTIIKKDGSKIIMKDDQYVDMYGNIIPKARVK